jgi:S1-C subfamily serine protease
MDGRDVASLQDVSLILNSKRPGETVRLGLLRDGQPVAVTVTLAEAQSTRARRAV